MAILNSALVILGGLSTLLALPAATAQTLPSPDCQPQANFTLYADAPGTVVDGWRVVANQYDYYLGLTSSNKTLEEDDFFTDVTFFKNKTESRLYMYTEGLLQRLISDVDGDLQGSVDPDANGDPYYDENFRAEVELWPPSGHITFHPGRQVHEFQYPPPPAAVGGFYACFDNTFDKAVYFVSGGTYAFQTTTFYPTLADCIAFKPRIELTGFSLGCEVNL